MLRAPVVVIALLAAGSAGAADGSLIRDATGHDCATDKAATLYLKPTPDAKPVGPVADRTEVRVLGGKQWGKPAAHPSTDEEWARTWLHVRTKEKKFGWLKADAVKCGG